MNPHSLPPSHSHSFHNDTIYSSTSHNYTRYYSTIPRPRPHNMSQHQSVNQQQFSHPQNYSRFHQNASGATSSTMVAPPVLQEVYILDCKSCDTFLTNRGMRAVLLLQPDVPLYSSDALPVNCSASPGPPEYAPPYETDTADISTLACPAGIPAPPPRTCECLTQTLCCHGCGNAVGYMVVIPCHRCCSSVSPTNRHTNRHRFVFFNKEIKASERHYIPHEPGVITASPLLVSALTPSPSLPSAYDPSTRASPSFAHSSLPQPQDRSHVTESAPPLPTPPPESPLSIDYPSTAIRTPPPGAIFHQHPHFPSFQFAIFKPERGNLCAGDVIYWHHLSRNGEIPAVVEDERARHATPDPTTSSWAGR